MRNAFLAWIAFAMLGACASGPAIRPDEVARVKSVAIVGFEVVQQQPKELDLAVQVGGGGESDMPGGMAPPKLPVNAPHAREVYEIVRKSLATDFG